jgi:SAM-dependent methyltransferase/GT2 family glycosyltransferase
MGEIFSRPLPVETLPFTGERLTSALTGETEIEHLHRYLYARGLCRDKDVLDVASGEGYGSALLAQVATSVVGVEIAEEAVQHARRSYHRDNLRFVQGDARKMEIPSESVDVVVSFETIEHFVEQEEFLKEVRRVLRPGGLFVVSTPDRDNYSPAEFPANPYHALELTYDEFDTILTRHFAHTRYLMQRPIIGSVMLPSCTSGGTASSVCFEKRGEQHFEASQGLARPRYVIAFASDREPAAPSPTVYVETSRVGSLTPLDDTQGQQLETLRQGYEIEKAAAAQEYEIEKAAAAKGYEIEKAAAAQEYEIEKAAAAKEYEIEKAAAAKAIEDLQAQQTTLIAKLEESESQRKALSVELDQSQRQQTVLAGRAVESESRRWALGAELDRSQNQQTVLTARIAESESRQDALRTELERSEQEIRALRLSTSWRITAPLRAIKQRPSSWLHSLRGARTPHRSLEARVTPSEQSASAALKLGLTRPIANPIPRAHATFDRTPISVVIPTYNRADLLEKTLLCCVDHSGSVEIEFVVIDDGSSDDTATVLKRLKNGIPNLTWRSIENGGPGKARNLGASIARHPIVLFLGDDVQPVDCNFFAVHSHLHALNPSNNFAVLGKVVWPEADKADVNFVMSHIQGRGGEQFGYAHLTPFTYLDWRFFYTSNVSVKKSVVSDWNKDGFQPEFKFAAFEDIEFAYRLQKQPNSLQIYYDPTSVGRHVHPYTLDGFINRQMGAGMMAKVFTDLHPEVAESLRLAPLLQALSSQPGQNQEKLTADYLSIVEGVKSWARIVEKGAALGREWWHEDLLSAVFELSYLQGFLFMQAQSSSNFAAAYDYILKRCLERLRKTIHHEVTSHEFLLARLALTA